FLKNPAISHPSASASVVVTACMLCSDKRNGCVFQPQNFFLRMTCIIILNCILLFFSETNGSCMDALKTNTSTGWRHERGEASLSDVPRTVSTARSGPGWRRIAAFAGPGYMVAVGYMDPGNWATSLAGGSKFGYTLLTVALLSNLMAIVLQSLCARL